ncbi:hypothetical protein PPERSA_01929 [Pseudocohnilembus persalinus]|uniref:Uncharacterized protein n=1 Tax=Pseudocohnilembus persalinus TaxID=266149 RepID=A0A0V0R3I6_PSEPJ|nr:hypothetical protein PPERSA_01929 [Pseudocohnilembus persalinus]|eukprot:KRX09042.1 hypothetical protein PPERSA_01929 [Pseudocohnilembus persalinus]
MQNIPDAQTDLQNWKKVESEKIEKKNEKITLNKQFFKSNTFSANKIEKKQQSLNNSSEYQSQNSHDEEINMLKQTVTKNNKKNLNDIISDQNNYPSFIKNNDNQQMLNFYKNDKDQKQQMEFIKKSNDFNDIIFNESELNENNQIHIKQSNHNCNTNRYKFKEDIINQNQNKQASKIQSDYILQSQEELIENQNNIQKNIIYSDQQNVQNQIYNRNQQKQLEQNINNYKSQNSESEYYSLNNNQNFKSSDILNDQKQNINQNEYLNTLTHNINSIHKSEEQKAAKQLISNENLGIQVQDFQLQSKESSSLYSNKQQNNEIYDQKNLKFIKEPSIQEKIQVNSRDQQINLHNNNNYDDQKNQENNINYNNFNKKYNNSNQGNIIKDQTINNSNIQKDSGIKHNIYYQSDEFIDQSINEINSNDLINKQMNLRNSVYANDISTQRNQKQNLDKLELQNKQQSSCFNDFKLFEEFFIITADKQECQKIQNVGQSEFLEPNIMFSYPGMEDQKDELRRNVVPKFAFPFGVEVKKSKKTDSLSELQQIIFGGTMVEKYKNCFVFALKSEDSFQKSKHLLHLPPLLATVNPTSLLYCIAVTTTDFLDEDISQQVSIEDHIKQVLSTVYKQNLPDFNQIMNFKLNQDDFLSLAIPSKEDCYNIEAEWGMCLAMNNMKVNDFCYILCSLLLEQSVATPFNFYCI